MKKFLLLLVLSICFLNAYAQSIGVHDGVCFVSNNFTFIGEVNGKNAYEDSGIRIEWNTTNNRWEIHNGDGFVYYYMTANSFPNPLDSETATNNGTPWTDPTGSCSATSSGINITGDGTQNTLGGCTDTQPPSITCPSVNFTTNVSVVIIEGDLARGGGDARQLDGYHEFTLLDEDNNEIYYNGMSTDYIVYTYFFEVPCDANYTLNLASGDGVNELYVIIDNETIISDTPPFDLPETYLFTVDPCNIADNSCTIEGDGLTPEVSDDCSTNPTVTYTLSGATTGNGDYSANYTLFNIGTTTLTYTATDDEGNVGTCSVDITVLDLTPPIANCPSDQNVSNDAGLCSATVSFTIPDPTDDCSTVTSTASPASGSSFAIGTTPVTVTATDAAGNTANCMFNVIVSDTEAPTANCPPDQTVSNDAGACGANVSFTIPDPTDNCPGATSSANLTSASFFAVGTTPVTVTTTDVAGNIDICSFNVIVNDTEAPTANCPLDQTVSNDAGLCGASVNFIIPDNSDNCTSPITIATPASGYLFTVGTTPVSVTTTDAAGNTSDCSFNVTVNDTEAPNMVCNDFNVNLTGSSATITTTQVNGGSTDNCGITNLMLDHNTFSCNTLGAQSITLTGTDAAGNSSSCVANITVIDNNLPIAVCINPTVNLTSDGTTTVAPDFFDGGSSVVCGGLTYAASMSDFDCNDVGNTYNVTLTVTAQNGQTANCTSTVTVADPNSYCCAPANAVCNNTTVVLNASGMGSILPSDIGGGSTAECGLMAESVSLMNFSCQDIGNPVSVTYSITDINGAMSSCVATVTVEDNIPPVPVCLTSTIELSPDGTYNLQETDVYNANASSDNCSIDNINFTATTYDCNDEDQAFTATVSVTDAGGNTASCNATITVKIGNQLPDTWQTNDIGATTIGNTYSFDPCADINSGGGNFTITGSGNNALSNATDNVAFASQTLCGDITITAKIESISPGGYGGLMIRESTDANSKQVAIFSNQSSSLRHETRYFPGANKVVQNFIKPAPYWLRLQRQGNWVFAYYSSTGFTFQYVHAVYVPMDMCVEVGLASFTYLSNTQAEAIFSNVEISGSNTAGIDTPDISTTTDYHTVNLYPNPATSNINLVFEAGRREEVTAVLRNQMGQIIEQRRLYSTDIRTEWDVSTLLTGIYFIEIRKEGQLSEILRFVKTL